MPLLLAPAAVGAQIGAPAEPAGTIGPATAVVGARVAAPAKGATAPRKSATATGKAATTPASKPTLGKVVGVLTDAATGETLIGGQVGVQGLALGNVSDETGSYHINSVPPGKQTLTVEYLGYLPLTKEVDVQPGGPTTADFALTPEPITGEEVVVEEKSVIDLSDRVESTALPTLQSTGLKEVEIERSDTTLMEEWHRSWKDFSVLYSIEYPMMGQQVYFRRPPEMTPPPPTAAGEESGKRDARATALEGAPAPAELEAGNPSAGGAQVGSDARRPAATGETGRLTPPSSAPTRGEGDSPPADLPRKPRGVQNDSPRPSQLAEQPVAPGRALPAASPSHGTR